MRRISSRMLTRSFASRLERGSSIRRIWGEIDQRPGQGDPLLLAPAQLAGGPVLQAFELNALDDLAIRGRSISARGTFRARRP